MSVSLKDYRVIDEYHINIVIHHWLLHKPLDQQQKQNAKGVDSTRVCWNAHTAIIDAVVAGYVYLIISYS